MVGASIGYHLAKAGVHVTLIDRDAPGSVTTNVSFAWINALGKRPEHYHRFSLMGVEAYTPLLEALAMLEQDGETGGVSEPASIGGLELADAAAAVVGFLVSRREASTGSGHARSQRRSVQRVSIPRISIPRPA